MRAPPERAVALVAGEAFGVPVALGVDVEARPGAELLAALHAPEGTLAGVDGGVLHQAASVPEPLAADVADVVALPVRVQVVEVAGGSRVHFGADGARAGSFVLFDGGFWQRGTLGFTSVRYRVG